MVGEARNGGNASANASDPGAHGARIFALTGGIASGKSTVGRIFRAAGLPVVDADELARLVVEPGSAGLAEVARAFGEEVLLPSGALDRAALGRIVFADEAERRRLNDLLHPRIREAAQTRFRELAEAGEALICYEIPLLFETAQENRFRPVVVVGLPEALQIERLRARDGQSEAEARARIRAQMPLADKIARADYVIDNSGDHAHVERRALDVLSQIRARDVD